MGPRDNAKFNKILHGNLSSGYWDFTSVFVW